MSRITQESFVNYSKRMIKDGFKICPCCLSSKLEFRTDDEHSEYILECKSCGVGVRNHIFARIKKAWNNRCLSMTELNKVTHDIDCTWWDDDKQEVITVTLDA